MLLLHHQVIIAVPGEFTTMAGRRIRAAVYETVKAAWGADVKVRGGQETIGVCAGGGKAAAC